ncbi:MAG: preprotein translocase subunit SecG [Clostridia bacterium]|jgi:preprotein translocase subunit SecG|nr:preprotein translocase subunit SecG [Clostridia bacterium]
MDSVIKVLNLLAPAKDAATYTTYLTISIVFVIAMFVAAVAAIILVLIQPGNSEGIDALGGSSETFFGKNKGKSTEATLKKWTIACLVVLAVLAIIFFILQTTEIWS